MSNPAPIVKRSQASRGGVAPAVGSELITYRALEFFPEFRQAEHYTAVGLSGEPFEVPAQTKVVVAAVLNDRALLKVSSPRVGYRFTRRDEYIAPGESAPPESRRAPAPEEAAVVE